MKLLSIFLFRFKNKLKVWLYPEEEEDIWIIRNYKYAKVKVKDLFKEL